MVRDSSVSSVGIFGTFSSGRPLPACVDTGMHVSLPVVSLPLRPSCIITASFVFLLFFFPCHLIRHKSWKPQCFVPWSAYLIQKRFLRFWTNLFFREGWRNLILPLNIHKTICKTYLNIDGKGMCICNGKWCYWIYLY